MIKNFVFILFTILIFGCKDNNKLTQSNAACETCKLKAPDFQKQIEINDVNIHFDFWRGASKEINDANYALGIAQGEPISSSMMGSILSSFEIGLEKSGIINSEIMACVFYTTSEKNKLSRGDVMGISLFYVKNNKLNVSIYDKKNDQFALLTGLTKEISSIPVLDFYKTSLLLLGQNSRINALVVSADAYSKAEFAKIKSNSSGGISFLLDFKLNNNKPFLLSDKGAGYNTLGFTNSSSTMINTGCKGFPCELDEPGSCYYEPGTSPICDNPCFVEEAYLYSENNTDKDAINPPLYAFRDNVLLGSDFGRHVVDQYYYCGSILQGKMTAPLAKSTFSIIHTRILPVVNKLSAAKASRDNTPIFNTGDADAIIAFIGEVRSLSDDESFLLIMDEIRSNVQYMDGKTVSQIYNDLQ